VDIDQALLDFAQASREDISRLLMSAAHAVNAEAIAAIDPTGESGVRLAHVPLIAALDPGGTRIGDLADRMGVTRQAVAQLAKDLERAGQVTVAKDPSDARATLVCLNESGALLCAKASAHMREQELRWRALHGDEAVESFKRMLRMFTE
jgi:DNA-binding MarR family transcriptional regulator